MNLKNRAENSLRQLFILSYIICLYPIPYLLFRQTRNRSIKARIKCVEVSGIKLFLNASQRFTEALEMHDFSGPKEADRIGYIRVLDESQNIVVGASGFLFWCNFVRTTIRIKIRSSNEFR